MFKALKQIVIIVLFLLLSVFASLYFQEDRENIDQPKENSAATWLINAVKKTGGIFSSLAEISFVMNPKLDFSANENFSNWQELGSYDFKNSEILAEGEALTELLEQKTERSEFRQFLNDFLKNIPDLYFNSKVYSNAWRNFKSLDWSRYNN